MFTIRTAVPRILNVEHGYFGHAESPSPYMGHSPYKPIFDEFIELHLTYRVIDTLHIETSDSLTTFHIGSSDSLTTFHIGSSDIDHLPYRVI